MNEKEKDKKEIIVPDYVIEAISIFLGQKEINTLTTGVS